MNRWEAPLPGFVPVLVSLRERDLVIRWCDFTGERLTDPFFDQTVTRLLRNPYRAVFLHETVWESAPPPPDAPAPGPSGIIFHMSRCGSTLLAGMLRTLPQNTVLSEPAPLHQLLTLRRTVPGIGDEVWRDWLRALLSLAGRARFPEERRWYLKCDALHTLDLPFVLSAFPGAPWVFLHRDPVEIITAHTEQPAGVMLPGGFIRGWEGLYSPPDTSSEDHIAKVLAAVCGAALNAPAEKGMFVEYRHLTSTAWPTVARHFGLSPEESADERIREASSRDAKSGSHTFTPDAKTRQERATPEARAAAERLLGHLYPRLLLPPPNPAVDPAWVPARIRFPASPDGPRVEWRRIGEAGFTQPFFRETIAAAAGPVMETPWTALTASGGPGPLPPAGFIFHLSRCGSTLLCRMLAAAPENVILSEPTPVNDLLWPEESVIEEPETTEPRLRALLAALGRRRFPEERRLFVKFDSWHTLDLPLIRRAFPDVPWLFVYREPSAILASHDRERGSQMIPGFLDPDKLGVPLPPRTAAGLRGFAARVLSRVSAAALEHHDSLCRLVHYSELPAALPVILDHFRVPHTSALLSEMLAAARQDSKRPDRPFSGPRLIPEEPPDGETETLYHRLENLRRAQVETA